MVSSLSVKTVVDYIFFHPFVKQTAAGKPPFQPLSYVGGGNVDFFHVHNAVPCADTAKLFFHGRPVGAVSHGGKYFGGFDYFSLSAICKAP